MNIFMFFLYFLDQGYNANRNQWFNSNKMYRPAAPSWADRSSDSVESENLFNAGYRRIPFFTYTAVLPYGFIYELKSQAIEIPLDVSIQLQHNTVL